MRDLQKVNFVESRHFLCCIYDENVTKENILSSVFDLNKERVV